jgi:hypothetical protein
LKNINNRYRDDRENSEYFESRDKIVEGDEPTTETRVLKVMNQQPRFSMAMNQRSRVLKAMNQQLRQEAVTTATTNNWGVKNTSKRTNLVENQPKGGWRLENLMEPNQKSAGYKEAKTNLE